MLLEIQSWAPMKRLRPPSIFANNINKNTSGSRLLTRTWTQRPLREFSRLVSKWRGQMTKRVFSLRLRRVLTKTTQSDYPLRSSERVTNWGLLCWKWETCNWKRERNLLCTVSLEAVFPCKLRLTLCRVKEAITNTRSTKFWWFLLWSQ